MKGTIKIMKIFVFVLKILLMIATGACAIFFNVFGSISMLATGQAEEYGISGQVIFWMVMTIVLYIVPAFLVMFKKYIIAAGMTFVGMICVFVLHEMLSGAGRELYLQLLFITLLAILIAIFGNWDKIHDGIDRREEKKRAVAPSILGGTTQAGKNVKTTAKKKNKK